MRWLVAFVLAAEYAGLTAAHADPDDSHHALPKLLGSRRFLSEFGGRRKWETRSNSFRDVEMSPSRSEGYIGPRGELEARQRSGRCGASRGSCAEGYCCSAEGYCGQGEEYCTSPDCQINYGPGCDGNQKPDGTDTSTIERPKLGKIAYGGVGIYDCVNDGDIALTFDDGPYDYTDDLLDKLSDYEAKATFFITGNNLGKGKINDPEYPWAAVIQRMAAEGHQIASHTWSHENFTQLSTTQAQNQVIWNEIALNDILGFFPTYLRPPYSICEAACQTMLANLGYHVTYFDLDTEGYLHDDASEIQVSKDIWDDAVDGSSPCEDSYLQIEHDIHYQTVYNLTDYILQSLFDHGYRSVTVGQCLGDPPENWYRAGTGSVPEYTFEPRAPTGTWACLTPTSTTAGSTPTSTLKVSTDGKCGSGVTCLGSQFGNCCSVNSWCGNSIDYCGADCQIEFGSARGSNKLLRQIMELLIITPAPTGTLEVSIDGNCGGTITCEGSEFGNCCSQHGWCGTTDDYCADGCQLNFGSGCYATGQRLIRRAIRRAIRPRPAEARHPLDGPRRQRRPSTSLMASLNGT
ncbi:carbohydrate esterase family 4 protein [Xylariaceae sp. FL0662B]|nr:carbohydrate esterase family 4 protein [Xylariaceae sp. FL0662B]